MNKLGKRRLLKLADILDTADAEHRKAKQPTYDQTIYKHPCGTPACALGHWAAANRRRWVFNSFGHPRLKISGAGPFESATYEFDLGDEQAEELFGVEGCGGAKTAKQAAKYIRKFVARQP